MNCEDRMRPAFIYDSWYLHYPNDYYILHKGLYKKLSFLSGVLLVVFLLLTAVYGANLKKIRPVSQKVAVYVAEVDRSKNGNDVYVIYNDQNYEVINVTDSEIYKYKASCSMGRPIEVFLGEDGNLYSNMDGMRNNTVTGKKYFVFLIATIALIFSTAVLTGFVIEANKREKGIYPKY